MEIHGRMKGAVAAKRWPVRRGASRLPSAPLHWTGTRPRPRPRQFQMVAQQRLRHATQIASRLQIPGLEQRVTLQTGPVGENATA